MPKAHISQMSVGLEIILRGELLLNKQPPNTMTASADQKEQEIVEPNNKNAMVVGNEATEIGDKCVGGGEFCTSHGPLCCEPLICVNFLLVGVGLCGNLQI